ncbi:MAG: PP2C family protein-serine/threonine phosphatase [Lachnospiraceae bacterium]|nr:PP2C family protein-serine/threonine phosphatase [Lachnospiraceae bacterium]
MKKMSLGIKLSGMVLCSMLILAAALFFTSTLEHGTKVDEYYKEIASKLSLTVADSVDGDLVARLRLLVEEDEFKELRKEAEETGNWEPVWDYIEKKGVREQFEALYNSLEQIRKDMDVKYIYIHSIEGSVSVYLVSAPEGIEYLGLVGPNAEEFSMYTTNVHIDPDVSNMGGEWVCSAYEPIYDSAGNAVSTVGVDIDMNQVMADRNHFRYRMINFSFVITVLTVIIGIMLVRKYAVKPIEQLTEGAKAFSDEEEGYSKESVISMDIHSGDEIETLYNETRIMQLKILDYVANITKITAEKERISAELNVATQIQADMLPRIFPPFPERNEFDLYDSMNPAKEVGGDVYDFFMIDDDHLGLVMADVSGKGVPAALFMVIAKTLIKNRALSGNYSGPGEVLADANNQLCEGNEAELFVTVWFGILTISTGHVIFASGGHEYPAFYRLEEGFRIEKDKHGMPLATMEGLKFRETETDLKPGERLFLYTDGVTEATNGEQELFGEKRMIESLQRHSKDSIEDMLLNVRKDIDAFVGDAPQFDDLTMLGIVYKGV